jgi:hypothetical protein
LDDGGTQAAFNKSAYDKAMKGVRHEYECSENFFKHDSVFSARAKIPVITARVDDIMNKRYSEPCPFGRPMIISVIDASWDPTAHQGSWRSISPEEWRRAYLGAIARDVRAGVKKDRLEQWLRFALGTTFKFVFHADEMEMYFQATNFREEIHDDFEYTRISTYQRVVEIYLFKAKLIAAHGGAVSNQRVQDEYNQHVNVASKADPINKSWVDMAIKIYEQGLILPEVVDVVVALEEYGSTSPFNYITVLHGFITKARTKANVVWCFKSLQDYLRSKELRIGDISVRYMIGDTASGNRGLVDLLLLQKDFKEYLLGPILTEMGCSEDVKAKLNSALDSHTAYRTNLTSHAGSFEVTANTSWQVGWPRPLLDLVAFIEDLKSISYPLCAHVHACVHACLRVCVCVCE